MRPLAAPPGAQPLHAVEAPPNKVQEWMRRAARHWSNVDNIVEEYAEIIAEEYWKAPGAQPLPAPTGDENIGKG